jgi:hypothetical protein
MIDEIMTLRALVEKSSDADSVRASCNWTRRVPHKYHRGRRRWAAGAVRPDKTKALVAPENVGWVSNPPPGHHSS